jgi:hypothetical protein
MANIMTTYVKVGNLNEETHKRFVDLFEDTEDLLSHFNKIYSTEFSDYDELNRDWMVENIGSKWISIECDEDLYYDDSMDLVLETAWSVPTEYLQKVVEFIGGDVVVYGTYEDESYDPIGAFVYAVDYDDIEDYEEVELERILEDDDYMESMYDGLYQLRDSLYESYLEVIDERANEEQD